MPCARRSRPDRPARARQGRGADRRDGRRRAGIACLLLRSAGQGQRPGAARTGNRAGQGGRTGIRYLELEATMTRVPMEGKVLNENERAAAELRAEFARHGVFAVNLISSPGSGKTALLERTLESYDPARRVAVLTGDIQTDADAARLAPLRIPRAPDHHRRRLPPGRAHGARARSKAGTSPPSTCCSSKTWATWSAPPATIWARRRRSCC